MGRVEQSSIEPQVVRIGPQQTKRTTWGFRLLIILHHIVALIPLAPIVAVYGFSWRVETIIGHWPLPSIDDPKFVAPGDWLSDFLYSSVSLLLFSSLAALLIFPVLTWVLRHQYRPMWLTVLIAAFILEYIFLGADPGQRFMWYFD